MRSEHPEGECLFCEIGSAEKDRENRVIFRANHWYIIVNKFPYCSGHIMVVLNRHAENIGDLTNEESAEMMQLLSRCEKAVRAEFKPHGINIGANLGRSAGAGIVGHLHLHLVPRWHGDTNFMTAVGETRVISEDLDDTYKRIRSHF